MAFCFVELEGGGGVGSGESATGPGTDFDFLDLRGGMVGSAGESVAKFLSQTLVVVVVYKDEESGGAELKIQQSRVDNVTRVVRVYNEQNLKWETCEISLIGGG